MRRNEKPFLVSQPLTFLILCCALAASHKPSTPSRETRPLTLTPLERAYVAKQLATHHEQVRMLVAAQASQSAAVRAQLVGIGASLSLFDPELDFIVAHVPITRVLDVLAWPGVATAEVDIPLSGALFRYTKPAASPTTAARSARPPGPPLVLTGAAATAHTGERATEARTFKEANPTYDGRGVVIGGLEPVNQWTPALTQAIGMNGTVLPKYVDYLMLPPAVVTTPAIPRPGRTATIDWQQTELVHPLDDGYAVFDGQRYRLPSGVGTGELRMLLLRTPGNGIPAAMAVLWAIERRAVWIVSTEIADFAKGLSLTLPSHHPHAAVSTLLEPETRRSIRVAADVPTRTLGVGLDWALHGGMCASAAAGKSVMAGGLDGIAPGAQFLTVEGSLWTATNEEQTEETLGVEPLFALFRDPRVEVVTFSGGATFGPGRRYLSDARRLGAQILNRLLEHYPKPLFVSSGDAAPSAIVDTGITTTRDAIVIGGYAPTETWEANLGLTPTRPETLGPYSMGGPTADGAAKPDLLALTETIVELSRAPSSTALASPYIPLSPSYALSGGTSASAPNAAGHAALLISAAKQAGIPWDLPRLRMALFSTAKFLEGVEARRQGHGLIQIAQAWKALQRLRDFTPPIFVTRAPLKTFYSDRLAAPNLGQGLYETIGWTPGQNGERVVTITRTTGPDMPITYALRWHGDVGAFTSPVTSVTVPLNRPVPLPVHIQIADSGSYSAIVDLIDPDLHLAVHSVLCTIVAAEQLTAENSYSVSVTRTAPRPGFGLVYVNVPAGATALRVEMRQRHGTRVGLKAAMPDARPALDTFASINTHSQMVWEPSPSDRPTDEQTFEAPMPGVWAFWLTHDDGWSPRTYDAAETHPAQAAEFTLRVTAICLDGRTEPARGGPGSTRVTFRNQCAPIERTSIRLLGVGTERARVTTLKSGLDPSFYEIEVPAGAADLELNVEPLQSTNANVSLLVWRDTSEAHRSAANVAMEIGAGATKHVVLRDPAPGRYIIGLDAWGDIPPAGISIRYREAILRQLRDRRPLAARRPLLNHGEILSAVVPLLPHGPLTIGEQLVARVGVMSDVTASVPFATRTVVLARTPGRLTPANSAR